MVETVIATLATSALNAGAISVGTATTIAGAGGIASTIGTGLSLLSGVGAVAGALGQVAAGKSAATSQRNQANQELLNARLEKVKAEDQANVLRRNLIANIGSANAMFASRGIGLGSGTPEQAKVVGADNASRNIDKARFGGDMAASDREVQAGQLRMDARASKSSGYANAAMSLAGSKAVSSLLTL